MRERGFLGISFKGWVWLAIFVTGIGFWWGILKLIL